LAKLYEGSVWVSAATGENLDVVINAMGERLRSHDRVLTLQLPLDRGDLLAAAHREGDVLDTSISDDGVLIHVVLDAVGAARFREWRVPA
jgi:GTP-binding protein HflX